MFNSLIEEIKSRLDVVEVVQDYIKLQKAGVNYKAFCPFHSEKTPSFFVSPTRQIWHCFGCGAGYNIFDFVMKIEGIEFGDALRILARKAGIEIKKQDPKLKTERQRLYEICELASRFFEKQLEKSKIGKTVKKYLLKRKIKEESIKKWRLGYAPDTWQGLFNFLISKGYKREEIEKAGLIIKNEKGHFYDRFRKRIIFPIFDLNSQVIGFGGRIFQNQKKEIKDEDEKIAKYINTPNTLLYNKSKILYGLDKAKFEIRKQNACILVEGYTDVIMSSQTDFKNVVAISGTALTPYQLAIIKRYSNNLIIAFDMDIAGDFATKRGIELAIEKNFNIKIVVLPKGKDPADIILNNALKWKKLLKNSISILDFYFKTAISNFDKETVEGKKEISKILIPIIKKIPNKIEQSYWIQQLAKLLRIREEDIIEELKKIKIGSAKLTEGNFSFLPNSSQKSRIDKIEERLIVLILRVPLFLNLINKENSVFFSPQTFQIISYLKKNFNPQKSKILKIKNKILQKKFSTDIINAINTFLLKKEIKEIEDEKDKKKLEEEVKYCLKEIKKIRIKNKLNLINKKLKKIEGEKDPKKNKELIKEFNYWSKALFSE